MSNSGQMTPTLTPTHPSARARVYRSTALSQAPGGSSSTWATREIAALDFLLGIPLENERSIVRAGLNGGEGEASGVPTRGLREEDAPPPSAKGAKKAEVEPPNSAPRWWEKLISKDKGFFSAEDQKARRRARLELEEKELEKPTGIATSTPEGDAAATADTHDIKPSTDELEAKELEFPGAPASTHPQRVAPGRRLDGRDAVTITIPKFGLESKTRQRIVARQAAVREWEFQVAHGIGGSKTSLPNNNRGLLDGRAFFSQKGSYPVGVFSVIKYEPKKEEAERKRKIVERLGRGGTDFVMPERDWRGISYRALLPRIEKKNRAFNRLISSNKRKIRPNPNNKLPAELDISLKGEAALKSISRRSSLNTLYSETTAATKISDEANPVHSLTNDDGSTDEEDDNGKMIKRQCLVKFVSPDIWFAWVFQAKLHV